MLRGLLGLRLDYRSSTTSGKRIVNLCCNPETKDTGFQDQSRFKVSEVAPSRWAGNFAMKER